jgi:hypothetical protein
MAGSATLVSLCAGVAVCIFASRIAGDHHLAAWTVGLGLGLSLALLAGVVTYPALVTVGGIIVLYRDSCEERGVPYAPTRPRQRSIGPVTAAIRRRIRPQARLLPGELVEVRGLSEILETLDEEGRLDGLPFMPEMVMYCGHRFPVHRRVDKVWEYAHGTGLRRVDNAVLLADLRCGGQSHGGCQTACQLIWKEAWLRRPGEASSTTSATRDKPDLDAHTQVLVDGTPRYVCQMTEVIRASTQLRPHSLKHYWLDLVRGNVRLKPFVEVLSVRMFNGVQWRLNQPIAPFVRLSDRTTSLHEDLGLQPGELVRVKSKRAIEATVTHDRRNRGLTWGGDMIRYSGGSYRVRDRVSRMVHEETGELLVLKTPSILLDQVHAIGGTLLIPQEEFLFWREIWLERLSLHSSENGEKHE